MISTLAIYTVPALLAIASYLFLFIHHRRLPRDVLLEAVPIHPVLQPERTGGPVLVEELALATTGTSLCRVGDLVLGRVQALVERLEQGEAGQRRAALGGQVPQALDAVAAVLARVGAWAQGGRGARGEEDERGAEDGVRVVPCGAEAWGVGAVGWLVLVNTWKW